MTEKDKKTTDSITDLVTQEIPELPVLAEKEPTLQGANKMIHDFKLGYIERREIETKRQILADTRIQLLRDRTSEVVTAWRIEAAVARERVIKAAEEYAQAGLELSTVKMTENKNKAIEQAIGNYWNAVSNIRPDLPDELKNKFIEKAMLLLDKTIEDILAVDFDIDHSIARNYPRKKRFRELLGL